MPANPMPSTMMNTTTSISDSPRWRRLLYIARLRLNDDGPAVDKKGRARALSESRKEEHGGRAQPYTCRGGFSVGVSRDIGNSRRSNEAIDIAIKKLQLRRRNGYEDTPPMGDSLALRIPDAGLDVLVIPDRLALGVRESRDCNRGEDRGNDHHDYQLDERKARRRSRRESHLRKSPREDSSCFWTSLRSARTVGSNGASSTARSVHCCKVARSAGAASKARNRLWVWMRPWRLRTSRG